MPSSHSTYDGYYLVLYSKIASWSLFTRWHNPNRPKTNSAFPFFLPQKAPTRRRGQIAGHGDLGASPIVAKNQFHRNSRVSFLSATSMASM
jgi:hypothetical protein